MTIGRCFHVGVALALVCVGCSRIDLHRSVGRIAVVSPYGVAVFDPSGEHAILIRGVARCSDTGSWNVSASPDGRWIAVDAEAATLDCEEDWVEVVRPDGTHLRAFDAQETGLHTSSLTWSPDSTRLAMVDRCSVDILTIDSFSLHSVPVPCVASRTLAWSPNGNAIAYITHACARPATFPPQLHETLWTGCVMTSTIDGRTSRLVASFGTEVSWTPNGSILFDDKNGDGLWKVRPGGGTPRLIAGAGVHVQGVAWSPNGRKLAFCAPHLYAEDWGAPSTPVLIAKSCVSWSFAWSPDGSEIAHYEPYSGGSLFVTRADGSASARVPYRLAFWGVTWA